MQNENTQPQAFYTKPNPVAGNTPQTTPTQEPKKIKKSLNTKAKNIFAVAGLVLFLAIAMMGVLIAQRQVNRDGGDTETVAPNAPASQPKAVEVYNDCSVDFDIEYPNADCTGKTAWNDFQANGGEEIQINNEFNIGDEFVFRITIETLDVGVSRDVVVTDVLPDSLTFVDDPNNTAEVTNDGQIVTATYDEIGSTNQIRIEFKVRVNATPLGLSTNTASVTTSNNGNSVPGDAIACTYSFNTVAGVVECISKELYQDDTLISAGSALTRGEEYIYVVSINVENRSNGEVKIHDLIPDVFEYVGPAPGSEDYLPNDITDNLIFANLGVLEDEPLELGFIVKVIDDPDLGEFANRANIYAFPPGSRQKEPILGEYCEVPHTILPIGNAQCDYKKAFDLSGNEIVSGSELDIAQVFMYQITVSAEETTSGSVVVIDTLPDQLERASDQSNNTPGLEYNDSTREFTMRLDQMEENEEQIVQFAVQVLPNTYGEEIKNIAVITTDGDDDTAHSCELILNVDKKYVCTSECETTTQCQEINDEHSCYQGECRLTENLTSDSCEPPTETSINCDDTCEINADCDDIGHICVDTNKGLRCRLEDNTDSESCEPKQVVYTPTPTPEPGCNEVCELNADCESINHVCMTTSGGTKRCRLETYPYSTSCSAPIASAQPVLPEILPETGPADWLNWMKAGLVTLGVGTALFLLL